MTENLLLPVDERRQSGRAGAGRDQFERVVVLPHGPRRLGREAAVFRRCLVPRLPRAVHLVAEAPRADVVRRGMAVGAAEVGQRGAARMVAILEQAPRLVHAARAEVDRHHRRRPGLGAPVHEIIRADLVRLGRVPREVEAARTLFARANAVLPVVGGNEIPSGVAHDGDGHLAGQLDDVRAPAVRVRGGMPRLVDAGVDAAAEMLDE